jgi:hypothetical protein
MEKKPAELQLLNKIWLRSSSVIKIVKMKYNRIDIKWLHVSTSFKIYLEMLSYLYVTFTIFYFNTISLKCTFVLGSSKRTLSNRIIQFTCDAVNTHLNHRKQFYFPHLVVLGRYCACEILIANPIDCLCCLSRIFYFFLHQQFRS